MENQAGHDETQIPTATKQVEMRESFQILQLEKTVKEKEVIGRLIGEKRKLQDDYEERLERLSKRIKEMEEKPTNTNQVLVTSSNKETKCTRIYIIKMELSHQASLKDEPNDEENTPTYDWTVHMRGVGDADLSHIVDKVVFNLNLARSYPKPRRGCSEPPFKISEFGRGSFTMPIEISFKTFEKQDKRHEILYHKMDFTKLTGCNVEELDRRSLRRLREKIT
uniref:YEATS domain-containing protein n=1 Tax=Clytia hemisphaerica TaxID=252671 RepID=A0A7M5XEM3_9CNID